MQAKLIQAMGDDLVVCNAAKRSFGNLSEWADPVAKTLHPKDVNLIKYLARGIPTKEFDGMVERMNPMLGGNFEGKVHEDEEIKDILNMYRNVPTHWVPFGHCQMTFHIELPIFVARQLIRHTIGVVISEMSRRYVDEKPDFWFPEKDGWRVAAENVKQGSSDQCLEGRDAEMVDMLVKKFCDDSAELYHSLLKDYKVAPELARIILPQNVYTDWYWTVSLVTVARVCKQRLDSHAQKEIRDLVAQIAAAAEAQYPVSFKALMTNGCF